MVFRMLSKYKDISTITNPLIKFIIRRVKKADEIISFIYLILSLEVVSKFSKINISRRFFSPAAVN